MGWNPSGWDPEGWYPEGWFPPAPAGTVDPSRIKCRVRPHLVRAASFIARCFPVNVEASDNYLFPPIIKDPARTAKVELNFYDLCASKWRANEEVSTNEYVLPNFPTGFSYQATTVNGRTGSREPRWPTTADATVPDGGVTWTCRAAGANGLNAVSDPTAASDPAGLTFANVAVVESFKIIADISGGTDGSDYDAVFSFTLNGNPQVARMTVQVRKQ